MRRKLIFTILTVLALGACVPLSAAPRSGPAATQQAATGLAMANGMLTATYEAISTKQRPTLAPPPASPQGFPFRGTPNIDSTGVPVTGGTPVPAPANPTVAVPATVTATEGTVATSIPNTGTTTTDVPPVGATPDCNHALDAAAAGPKVRLVIRNDTLGPVAFSMGLSTPNGFGQCGYLAWAPILKGSRIVVEVPENRPNAGDACYWGFAQLNDPRKAGSISQAGICLTPSARWVIGVGYNRISYATQ